MPIATHKTIIYKAPELNQTTYDAIKSYIIRKDSKDSTDGNQEEEKVRHEQCNVESSSSNKLDATVIQQQLQTLEVKLESLKDKKHNLFLHLKKVLHGEDGNRRNHKEDVNAEANAPKSEIISIEAESSSKPSSFTDNTHGEVSSIETITSSTKRERDDSPNADTSQSHKQMKYSTQQQFHPYSPYYMPSYRHFSQNKAYRSPQKSTEEQSFTRPVHIPPHLPPGIAPFHLQQRFAANPQQLLPQQPSPMFFPGQMHPMIMPQMGLPPREIPNLPVYPAVSNYQPVRTNLPTTQHDPNANRWQP